MTAAIRDHVALDVEYWGTEMYSPVMRVAVVLCCCTVRMRRRGEIWTRERNSSFGLLEELVETPDARWKIARDPELLGLHGPDPLECNASAEYWEK